MLWDTGEWKEDLGFRESWLNVDSLQGESVMMCVILKYFLFYWNDCTASLKESLYDNIQQ